MNDDFSSLPPKLRETALEYRQISAPDSFTADVMHRLEQKAVRRRRSWFVVPGALAAAAASVLLLIAVQRNTTPISPRMPEVKWSAPSMSRLSTPSFASVRSPSLRLIKMPALKSSGLKMPSVPGRRIHRQPQPRSHDINMNSQAVVHA